MARFLFNNYYKYLRVIKFLIAGGTAASVNLVILYLLTEFAHFWYLISSAFAFIISFFVSFYLQKFWTFADNSREKIIKQMTSYLIVALLNLFLNLLLMLFFVEIVGLWYMLAQLISEALIATESYLVYNVLIFSRVRRKYKKQDDRLSKIRILIATGIYPPEIGGPATMLEALVKSLRQRGLAVKVITYSPKSVGRESITDDKNAEIHRIIRSRFKLFDLLNYFCRMFELASWADVIYATDTYSVGYFTYLIKKIFKRKYIIRFAGDSAWETAVGAGWTQDYLDDFLTKKYRPKIERLKVRRKQILVKADTVITVSNFLSGVARQIGVEPGKISLIYNSVDFNLPHNPENAPVIDWRKQYGREAKIIITACRLTPWKGVDGIIKILNELNKKIGQVFLLVLGEGSELNKLQNLAKERKVADRFKFLGRIDNRQIIDYFKIADLFILNSNYEGLSHTLLEAMTAGIPIIATKVGGNPEVLSDGQEGLMVHYNNQAELLEAAVKILTNQDLARRLVINAKEKLKVFNWEKTAKQTYETIKAIAYEESHANQPTV